MNEVHTQVLDLLPAYAFDALDLQDRETVEQHMDDCGECQSILSEYQQIGEGLLHIPKPLNPPRKVRARLIAMLAPDHEKRTWLQRLTQLPLLRIGAVGAVMVMIVLNFALLAQTRNLQNQVQALTTQQQSNQTGLALASYPNVQVAQIAGENVGGTIVYDPDIRVAVAYIWGLDQLESDQTYQAWLISPNGDRTSGGLIQPEEGSDFTVLVIESILPLSEYVGIGVTVEPEGGSTGPTGPRVLGAEL
jgi:anti-sigma-K factor RskA